VLGIFLIAGIFILGASAFLRTTNFTVEGISTYSAEEIIEASGLSTGDNLLFVNTQNVAQNIRATMPFVSAAQVSRVLPDTILIEITESKAIASILFAGEYYVIDSSGRVLARYLASESALPPSMQDLIEIRGVEIEETAVGGNLRPVFGTETKLTYMQDVLSALERDDLYNDASYLDVTSIVNVFFGYMGRYRVILGGSTNMRPSNIRHNMTRLVEAIPRVEERHPNTVGDLDLSDVNRDPVFRPT